MSVKQLTEEQRAAIESTGETLVSASAGSGKTFVMIEKIIALILEGKAEISSVLAVTFTNLAAAEMKEKLKRAIIARINEENDSDTKARLRCQLNEIGASDISTLHSFCANVIRRYFYWNDENGDFQIADEAEASELKNRAAETALESLLESGSEKATTLLDLYAGSKGAGRLRDLFLLLYEKMRVHADYRERLRAMPLLYTREKFSEAAAELFGGIVERAARVRDAAARLAEEAAPFAERGEMSAKYVAFAEEIAAVAREIAAAENLFAAVAAAAESKLSAKPSNGALKKAENAAALELDRAVGKAKDELKELLTALKGYEAEAVERERFMQSGEITDALCELLIAFDDEYAAMKKRAGKLDFSDLEHRALALLQVPAVRAELAEKYTHIFVDEYQDVNPCQESILNALHGKNVFLVGDVKQSIYGFRGCSAKFFAQKFERLSKTGQALVLNGNFRSAPKILDAVNTIFSAVMTRESGAVDYRNQSSMRASDRFPAGSGEVWFDRIPASEDSADAAEKDVYSVIEHLHGERSVTDAEGAYIADIIAWELGKKHFDADRGEYVRNEWKDIVVLSRSKTGRAGKIVAELIRRGIPVASAAEYNICEYPEIRRLIEILKYIDCAAQDIPLAAALKSGLGNVTDEELAKIRLYAGNEKSFVEACRAYAQEVQNELSAKLNAFYARTEELRLLSAVKSAAELIAKILSDTEEEIGMLRAANGEERLKRVDRFLSELGDLSVPDALRRLKNGGYKIGFSEAGGENAVRVMTMHASKGLEFPVVILAGMDNRFDDGDFREKVLTDDEYGFAPYCYDRQNFTANTTVLRALFRERMIVRRAEDEMRLLYVAATRAQYCMHFVFKQEGEFDFANVMRAAKFSDFIPFEKFKNNLLQVESATFSAAGERPLVIAGTDALTEREVLKKYARPYPFANSLRIPVKSSASALLKMQGERFYAERELFAEDTDELPTDSETGIAYHALLERADFTAPPRAECERILGEFARTRPDFAARIDASQAEKILKMPLFSRLSEYRLMREQEFLLSLPACVLFDTDSEDEVLFQGVIDLLALRGDRAILIDYKFSRHGDEQLIADYSRQLQVYAEAVRRIAKCEHIAAYIVNLKRLTCIELPFFEKRQNQTK